MRGADEQINHLGYKRDGSSPHAWGRFQVRGDAAVIHAVHPHMRGADQAHPAPRDHPRGSSPHAWGRCQHQRRKRFNCAVHPHMRGADVISPARAIIRSSVHPHMRGADRQALFSLGVLHRFIPTCVGQMVLDDYLDKQGLGFIPHAWGRYTDNRRYSLALRFIPTCVGQMYGAETEAAVKAGSSPHAWGRSTRTCTRRCRRAVHPHMRGADVRLSADAQWRPRFIPTCVGQMRGPAERCQFQTSGSSPHAWGRLVCHEP